jgi:probable HAF family extracellular repeat protein
MKQLKSASSSPVVADASERRMVEQLQRQPRGEVMSSIGSVGQVRRGGLASPALVVASLLVLAAACGSGIENPSSRTSDSTALSSSSQSPDAGTQYTFQFFDPPGSTDTEAFAINDLGAVVGTYTDANGATHSFVRSPRGSITTIDVPGATETDAKGINDFGAIVGYFIDASGAAHGFKRTPDGTIKQIDFPGAADTGLFGINNEGHTAGQYDLVSGPTSTGFLLKDGHFTLLTNPPGAAPTSSGPAGLNDADAIVGWFFDPAGNANGFVWTNGRYTTTNYPGATDTLQFDLNDFGRAVGRWRNDPQGTGGGYVLDIAKNSFVELLCPTDNPHTATPRGINNRGQISGTCGLGDSLHGFIATPVRSDE